MKPVGSAPDTLVAEETCDEADCRTLEIALETALDPLDAADDETLEITLEASEVIELITEEIELATD